MKRILAAIAAAVSLATLAACGSSGTHTQSLSPSTPDSSTSVSSTPATATSNSSTPTAPTSAPKPLPTPSVTPPAQGAVDAYIAMGNVLDRWDRNPKSAKPSELAPYVTSPVLKEIITEYQYMASHGLAYRGTPDTSHITVIAADQTSVAFSDCLVPSKTDPYTQYVIATGKPVASTNPPGLHPKAVTVVFVHGRWKVNSIIPHLARTCAP